MTRETVRAALTGRQALICTLYGEAAGEPLLGQIAVACVIRNRAEKPGWWGGPDYKSVCLAKAQFSCWWEDTPNTERVYAFGEALIRVLSPDVESPLVHRLGWIADGVMSEAAPDESQGATHYLTAALFSVRPPTWAQGQVPLTRLGHHVFLRVA